MKTFVCGNVDLTLCVGNPIEIWKFFEDISIIIINIIQLVLLLLI